MTDIRQMSDLELLLNWRRGDRKMGRELFERHHSVVTELFRRNVRKKSDIKDLVQQTFIACISGEHDPQIVGSVRGYILGIAYHTMTRFFRKERTSPKLGLDIDGEIALASVEPDPEYLLTLGEQQRLLMKAIRRLKLDFQVVIELNYWEGIPCDAIANTLNIPQGTVRSRLQHGRAALKKKLAELADSPELLRTTTMSVNAWQQGIRNWIKDNAASSVEAPAK